MSTLGDARMPSLRDKLVEQAVEVEVQAEQKAENEDIKSLKVAKIIKKKSKKYE